MKFLIDQNLSRKLVTRLNPHFPDTAQVALVGLEEKRDAEVRAFAATNGFTILSKDNDFANLVTLSGHPPKVVWIRLGNCSTRAIESELINSRGRIKDFERDVDAGLLVLPSGLLLLGLEGSE